MRHDLTLTGLAFRLRPVADADAALIVELRNEPKLGRWLHAGAASVEAQRVWLQGYYERPGDYYFVLERLSTGQAEGLISIYDIDAQAMTAEWGRWILQPSSLGAVESAWLIYRCAFEELKLKRLFSRTVVENQAVVSFHDSSGIKQRRLLPGYISLDGGKRLDAIEHIVEQADWPELGPRLERVATLTARRLNRS